MGISFLLRLVVIISHYFVFLYVQEKVTGAVSVLTPSADISSYVTILRIQPYLPSGLLEEVLSWRRIESTREK